MAQPELDKGFLWAEEIALKAWLTGITADAPNLTGGRVKVDVRFGFPDPERQRTYPSIMIDLLDVVPNWEETHSTQPITPDYWPDETPTLPEPGADGVMRSYEFLPMHLLYQVTVYSRNPLHDRLLVNRLLAALPYRWGSLVVPADGTVRRLELLDYSPNPFIDTDNKRTYRSAFTIQINAEIPPFQYQEFARAQQVRVDIETL